VIKSISLNDTVVFGGGILLSRVFFFCEPPFGGGGCRRGGAEKVGATFDSLIIACTMGFWDSK
jgi:hypothetical protein